MSKKNEVVYLHDEKIVKLKPDNRFKNIKEINRVFWAELKIVRSDYRGNLCLLPIDQAEEAEYLEETRPEAYAAWRVWQESYCSFWNNRLEYTVRCWKSEDIIRKMNYGILSGWWRWEFPGGTPFVSYLGKDLR